MRHFQILLSLLLSLFMPLPAFALDAPLPMEEAFRLQVSRVGDRDLALTWELEPGYYLYREYLSAKTPAGATLALETPAGKIKDDPGFGQTEIFYNKVEATIINPPADFTVTYQGCQEDGLCYPPTERAIDTVALTATEKDPRQTPGGHAQWPPAQSSASEDIRGGDHGNFAVDQAGSTGVVGNLLTRGGPPLLLSAFFGLGILLAFTPCVFPMYPILAATLARQGETLSAKGGFVLSLAYVLAFAFAFGLLGVAAAWSGQNLQIVLQSPYAVATVALLFVVLGLSSFGLFELQIPSALTRRLTRSNPSNKGSLGSAAALGFTSALIVGPCVTAPLAGALLYIAQTGDVVLGAASLFFLGLGKGVPLIIMGTFGSGVLPRAGAWMSRARQAFGFLFFASAVWLVERLLPPTAGLAMWSVFLLTFGVFIGAFDVLKAESGPDARTAKSMGLLAVIASAMLAIGAAGGATDPLRPLTVYVGTITKAASKIEKADFARVKSTQDIGKLLEAASAQSAPTLVYFTADWCVSCRTIERNVLPDPTVQEALQGMQLVDVDLTNTGPEQQALMRQMQVVGPPTMIFFDDGKNEVKGTRLVGEVTAELLEAAATASKAISK